MNKNVTKREKNQRKRIDLYHFFLVAILTIFSLAKADPLPDGGPYQEKVGKWTWNFCINNGEASIGTGEAYSATTSSPKPTGIVEIPSRLGGRNVTRIGMQAFRNYNKVTKFIVPEDIVSIENGAFEECSALESIELPSTLLQIGSWTFAHDTNLQEVVLPYGIEIIPRYCFYNMPRLRQLVLPKSIKTIQNNAISVVDNTVITFLGDKPVIAAKGLPQSANIKVSVYSSGWESESNLQISYIEGVDSVEYNTSRGVAFDCSDNLVSLSCKTKDSVIHYTLNGEDVNTSSPVYEAPFYIAETVTLKAVAFLNEKASGDLLSVDFIRTWYAVENVSFDMEKLSNGGSFAAASQTVTLSCATDGATIYYTIDGSEPSSASGRIYKGPFDIYQTTIVKAIAVKDDWKDSEVAVATFTKENELGPALNLMEVMPDNDKTHPWTIVTDETHDGISAVRSGVIGEDESTTLKAVVYGAGRLSFWWKTACEPSVDGEYYDYAAFFNGSTEVAKLAGVTDWQQVVLDVAGTGKHTFKWTYQKDDSGYEPPDCVWLDQVQWLPKTTDFYAGHTLTTETPVPYAWLDQYGLGRTSDFEAAAKAKSGKIDGAGHALTVEEEYIAGTDPTNAASRLETRIEMANGAPVVTWTPDLNEGGAKTLRTYKVWGKDALESPTWEYPTNALHHFFKVTVEMP